MSASTASTRSTTITVALLLVVGFGFLGLRRCQAPPHHDTIAPEATLSPLATPPDWMKLEPYQHTITRSDFERLLTQAFTTSDAWMHFIDLHNDHAIIRTSGDAVYTLRFATPERSNPPPRLWRPAASLPPASPDRPLDGLRIAIDPGHIGGKWALIEERSLTIGDNPPICEGDMTLLVADLLKPRLEALGATVSLVRDKPEPITPLRPSDLLDEARSLPTKPGESLQKLADRLFYRTAEIRARAELVNTTLKPDLTLCLHFNAEPWNNPFRATLVHRSHFHVLVNGAYTDEEVALEDQRFALLEKLLSRTHDEEAAFGASVANHFAASTGLPPQTYPPDAPNARKISGNPYLWARNLLANRLYDCPVLFMEPWVMNSSTDYPRMIAGDYEGTRVILGEPRISIFREYADSLASALADYYRSHRPMR